MADEERGVGRGAARVEVAGSRTGPFVFVAFVIVGCLMSGVVLASFDAFAAPAMVIAIVLACGVATLLYGILGGVSSAGFNFGPVKMGGSAAVLLGSIWLFNAPLESQLRELREPESPEVFDLDEHATPADGWFAIDEQTAAPIDVTFRYPASGSPQTVKAPRPGRLPLRLERSERGDAVMVLGEEVNDAAQRIGQASLAGILPPPRPPVSFSPAEVYGPKRLHLTNDASLPAAAPREWGWSGQCLGRRLPMRLRVLSFAESYAEYEMYPCGSDEADPQFVSSLAPHQAELVNLVINGQGRRFLVAVVAADHTQEPFWSSFVVMELVQGRGR